MTEHTAGETAGDRRTHVAICLQINPGEPKLTPTYSEALPYQDAATRLLATLHRAPGLDQARQRLQSGIAPGERDLTIHLRGPEGLMILALVELQDRTPLQAARDWTEQMATALRHQGIAVNQARPPHTPDSRPPS